MNLVIFIFASLLSFNLLANPSGQDILKKSMRFGMTDGELTYLLKNTQPDLTMKDPQLGANALYYSCVKNRPNMVKLLLEIGKMPPDEKNNNGETCLMAASKGGHTEVVKILLENGANKDLKDNNGKSALNFAQENNRQDLIVLLKRDTKALWKKPLNIIKAMPLSKEASMAKSDQDNLEKIADTALNSNNLSYVQSQFKSMIKVYEARDKFKVLMKIAQEKEKKERELEEQKKRDAKRNALNRLKSLGYLQQEAEKKSEEIATQVVPTTNTIGTQTDDLTPKKYATIETQTDTVQLNNLKIKIRALKDILALDNEPTINNVSEEKEILKKEEIILPLLVPEDDPKIVEEKVKWAKAKTEVFKKKVMSEAQLENELNRLRERERIEELNHLKKEQQARERQAIEEKRRLEEQLRLAELEKQKPTPSASNLKVTTLSSRYCKIIKENSGKMIAFISNLKIEGLKESGKNRAVWFINMSGEEINQGHPCKTGQCQDHPLFHSGQVRKDLFVNNLRVPIPKNTNYLQIYSSIDQGEPVQVSLKNCTKAN